MGKVSAKRPEHQAPPEIFYNEREAQKYTQNSRMMDVQVECTKRALELLALPPDQTCHLLDLGCGSGLSSEVLSDSGHHWVGMDISKDMLDVAKERDLDNTFILSDMGQGLPFRPATFDGAISISALQWLCYSSKKEHVPAKRLAALFRSLFACLSSGSRAVFQFYPENEQQVSLIVTQATKAGFTGGVVVDYPNSSRAKKLYLVLMCGGVAAQLPSGLDDDNSEEVDYQRRSHFQKKRGKSLAAVKEKIHKQKVKRLRQGKGVSRDSKYTGRPRSARF